MNYLIIKTIMAKKQLKIPFKDGRPCKWVKDVHDEERDNYEFDERLDESGEKYDSTRFDRRIDACQG